MTTLVIGASTNPARYANIAIRRLRNHNIPTYAYGLRPGTVADVEIETDRDAVKIPNLDTITLYVGPARQPDLYDWILDLAPRRIIFNPGTENPSFMRRLRDAGVEVVPACTLVMLTMQQY